MTSHEERMARLEALRQRAVEIASGRTPHGDRRVEDLEARVGELGAKVDSTLAALRLTAEMAGMPLPQQEPRPALRVLPGGRKTRPAS